MNIGNGMRRKRTDEESKRRRREGKNRRRGEYRTEDRTGERRKSIV